MRTGFDFPQCAPVRIFHPEVKEQAKQLRWIARNEPLSFGAIQTLGGFFTQPAGSFQFSFAVDPSLPVGDWRMAEPLHIRPNQHLSYRGLTPAQRACFLYLLGGAEAGTHPDINHYFSLR